MNELLLYLNSIHPLSDELQEHLIKILKVKELSRKEYLLKAGHVCSNVYFIQSGLLRCFYLKDTTEVCSWFMCEKDFIVSVESFFTQRPSYESIQALEDTEVYYISYSEIQDIYRRFPEFNFIGRVITEKYYILCEQRTYSLRMQQAIDRYAYLFKNFPEIIMRVPSKYIASYLGISEETLSRIKGKKLIF
jgi:CRP-like cAMP-binding protein